MTAAKDGRSPAAPFAPRTLTVAANMRRDVADALLERALSLEQRARELRAGHPARGGLERRAARLRDYMALLI